VRLCSVGRKVLWTLGVYVLALLLPMGVDHFTELLHVKPYDYRDTWLHAVFKAGYWYQRLVTASPRKPRLHYVRVVVLRAGKEPDEVMGQNLCGESGQRAFMARLLRKLKCARPAIIVVDKWYAPGSCPLGDPGTNQLRDAIADVSRDTPIILGQRTEAETDLERRSRDNLSQLRRRGFRSYELVGLRRLRFGGSGGSGEVSYGVLRLNYDVRKIPLNWPVYGSEDDIGRPGYPRETPSLSLAAARRYDPRAAAGLTRHPFTSFLNEHQLRPRSAIELVCGPGSGESSEWQTCLPDQGERGALADLRNHVVVVGEENPEFDYHETPIGEMAGVLLQANYIESLLDDRYLRPVSGWILVVLSIVWFVLIEYVFHRYSARLLAALCVSLGVTVVIGMLLYVVAVVNWGRYLALWPTGVVAVVLRFLLAFALGAEVKEEKGRVG
jgi:CHASE2 domain